MKNFLKNNKNTILIVLGVFLATYAISTLHSGCDNERLLKALKQDQERSFKEQERKYEIDRLMGLAEISKREAENIALREGRVELEARIETAGAINRSIKVKSNKELRESKAELNEWMESHMGQEKKIFQLNIQVNGFFKTVANLNLEIKNLKEINISTVIDRDKLKSLLDKSKKNYDFLNRMKKTKRRWIHIGPSATLTKKGVFTAGVSIVISLVQI